jgi:hypoxanthine phosphoribosyltransferase
MHATRTVPPHYDEVYPAPEVASGVNRVAAAISPWAAEVLEKTGKQVLGVCILRGAVFFFTDLLKAIPVSVEPGFCRCRSYRVGVNGQPAETIEVEWPEANLADRHVLLVDDICDTGRTLQFLSHYCRERGAAEVKTAVLIHRNLPDSMFHPDFAAFRYQGLEWFAGYGMDDRSWRMNYPAVYALHPGA